MLWIVANPGLGKNSDEGAVQDAAQSIIRREQYSHMWILLTKGTTFKLYRSTNGQGSVVQQHCIIVPHTNEELTQEYQEICTQNGANLYNSMCKNLLDEPPILLAPAGQGQGGNEPGGAA